MKLRPIDELLLILGAWQLLELRRAADAATSAAHAAKKAATDPGFLEHVVDLAVDKAISHFLPFK